MTVEKKPEIIKGEFAVPINDIERFEPNYCPETAIELWCDDLQNLEKVRWAKKEVAEFEYFTKPFFTNLDKPVFVVKGLPEEVVGALSSRLSRTTHRFRRLFWQEYIRPILRPDLKVIRDKNLDISNERKEVNQLMKMRNELTQVVSFLHDHGVEQVSNTPRARDFFKRWLSQYGDESIAQLEAVHLVVEGVSQVLIKKFEDFRIGHAPLEKSTRYVFFDQKVNDQWQYYKDPEILASPFSKEFVEVCDLAFQNYSASIEPLSNYLRSRFPKEKDQTERAYRETLKAKACDILRCYLPMATQTTAAFLTVGQTAEYILNRFYPDKLGEVRWLAWAMQKELDTVIPSLVERPKTARGQEYQIYFETTHQEIGKIAEKIFANDQVQINHPEVTLVDFDPDGEDKVIAAILYPAQRKNLSIDQVLARVKLMNPEDKLEVLVAYVKERKHRTHKTGRAFENTYYTFHINGNVGVFRDIHRHRMLTQDRPPFSFESGFDIPPDLIDAKLDGSYCETMGRMTELYQKMKTWSAEHAQYVVPMGAKVSWYQKENAREAIWEIELRTGRQGHPDYRRIEQRKFQLIAQVHPLLAKAFLFVDMGDYELARRESEKRIDRRLERLGEKPQN